MAKPAGFFAGVLNAAYEFGPDGITTKAYRDMTGYWTGPGGVRFHDDGSPVKEGDEWSLTDALLIYARQFDGYAAAVDRLVGFPLNPYQRDACTVLMWNIGEGAFANSTLIGKIKARRFEEAAEEFTVWRRVTLRGGTIGPDGTPVRGPDGTIMAKGLKWKKVVPGLFRRANACGLLFKGLAWDDATRPGALKIEATPIWNEQSQMWVDRVDSQTEWRDVVAVARYSPLPEPPVLETPNPPEPETVKLGGMVYVLPDDFNSWPEDTRTAWLNERMEDVLKPEPPVNVPAPKAPASAPAVAKVPAAIPTKGGQVPKIKPDAPAVPIENTKRGKDVIGKARGRDVGIISTITGGSVVTAATNAEKVGGVIEKLSPQTWMIMIACLCGLGIIYGVLQWWWSRASLYERREREQEPVY